MCQRDLGEKIVRQPHHHASPQQKVPWILQNTHNEIKERTIIFKKRNANIVVSPLDEDTLKQVCVTTLRKWLEKVYFKYETQETFYYDDLYERPNTKEAYWQVFVHPT